MGTLEGTGKEAPPLQLFKIEVTLMLGQKISNVFKGQNISFFIAQIQVVLFPAANIRCIIFSCAVDNHVTGV